MQPDVQPNGHLRVASQEHFLHVVELDEPIHHLGRIVGDGQEVEIADRLLATAEATGDFQSLDGRALLQMGRDGKHVPLGRGPKHAPFGLGGQRKSVENDRFGLRAESLECMNAARFTCLAQLVQRGDVQLAIDHGRPFWTQPWHAEDGQDALGNLGEQLIEHRQRAGLDERNDFGRQILADPLDLANRTLGIGHDIGRRLGQIGERSRRIAIRPNPKRIGSLKLEQVGDLLENGGEVGVGHGRGWGLGSRLVAKLRRSFHFAQIPGVVVVRMAGHSPFPTFSPVAGRNVRGSGGPGVRGRESASCSSRSSP